jgi:CDP-diacylglycerol---glycerol-3-phosphate 3-phosphatidyltransferase
VANFITIFRILLAFIAISLMFQDSTIAILSALVLTIIAFLLDGLDGWVARKFNESSKLGAVLDIMSDRIVENIYWVAFAVLGILPIGFPIIALTRSFVVDSLRSVAMEKGYTAFGKTSMQKDKVGYFICSSKFSRITYAAAKCIAFIVLIAFMLPNLSDGKKIILYAIGGIAAIIAIQFCVIRGLPVVFESKKLFKSGSTE